MYSELVIASIFTVLTTVNAQSSSLQQPTVASPSATAPADSNGYRRIGCYNDTQPVTGSRALSDNTAQRFNDDVNIGSCTQFCKGKKYAAIEFGRECYCGDTLSSRAVKVDDGRCNYACNGNGNERCGGIWALSMYQDANTIQGSGTTTSAASTPSPTGAASILAPAQPLIFGALAIVTLAIAAIL